MTIDIILMFLQFFIKHMLFAMLDRNDNFIIDTDDIHRIFDELSSTHLFDEAAVNSLRDSVTVIFSDLEKQRSSYASNLDASARRIGDA